MQPNLTHVALHVKDLDQCVNFYEDFCNMHVIHRRVHFGSRIVWLAEQGREAEFVFVLMNNGEEKQTSDVDYGHFGFALGSKESVDEVARKAKAADCLIWPAKEDPYPVGYYCGVKDPNGNYVEFSYGQPLGAGAKEKFSASHRLE